MTGLSRTTILAAVLLAAASALAPAEALAQADDSPAAAPAPATNPLEVLGAAAQSWPLAAGASSSTEDTAAGATDGQQRPGGLSSTLSILLLLTVLTVAPALLILCTSFTRIVVVLALLRQAIGTQSLPPSQVIVGLSMFLTFLVMAPTFERVNREALAPLQAGQIDQLEAWSRAKRPIREFMIAQIEHAGNEADVYMILNYRGVDTSDPSRLSWGRDVDMVTLIPAFILSELKIAFLIGFRLYLPFLIIDMVISSVLISMGMLMLPPVMISLPFKLLLFVLVDGWTLVAGNLLNSFAVVGPATSATGVG